MKKEKIYTSNIGILCLSVLCTLLWGSAYPCVKIGYEIFNITSDNIYGKLYFAGIRFFIAGVITIVGYSVIKKRIMVPSKNSIKGITLLAVIQTTIQYIFFYIGLSNTSGVKGSILNSISPFIVVIICHFITKDDRLNLRKTLACVIGFTGVVIINLGSGSSSGGFNFFGEGFIIIAALSFSIGSILSKSICKVADAVTVTGYQLTLGGFLLIFISLLYGGNNLVYTYKGIALLIYMSLLSAVAFSVWTLLLKYNSAGKISIYNFLTPVFGAILSSVFLNESILNVKNMLALCLVCIGVYIVNKPKKN